MHAVDSQIPLYEVRTMEERMQRAVVSQRAAMILLSAFAFVAMLLAVVGIYGVISWGVVQRTREMGVRMALGALRRDVMWLVLRRCSLLVFAGVSLGLLGASNPFARSFTIRSWPWQDAAAIWSECT